MRLLYRNNICKNVPNAYTLSCNSVRNRSEITYKVIFTAGESSRSLYTKQGTYYKLDKEKNRDPSEFFTPSFKNLKLSGFFNRRAYHAQLAEVIYCVLLHKSYKLQCLLWGPEVRGNM